jgi:hypothetical protein
LSLTNGSFAAPTAADLNKEVESFAVTIAAGAGVAAVVDPAQPEEGVTVFNVSNNVVRATVTFSAGIVAAGGAATRAFLVPAGGTASIDWADSGATDSAQGALGAIDSLSIAPVAIPVAAGVVEASALALATTATAGYVLVNFATA